MSSIESLERRLRRVVAQIEPEAKTWTFALEPGESIPPEIAVRIHPRDHIVVVEIPPGYLSGLEEEEVGSS